MPSFSDMCNISFTPRQWLQYYRNIWVRNAMGSMTDVMHDNIAIAANPDAVTGDMIPDGKGAARPMTFKERAESRKENVVRSNGIIAAVDALMALDDDALAAAMANGSDFLKAATAPESTESNLVSYTVLVGQQVTTDDQVLHTENTTLVLDPEADQTKAWVSANLIALTTASV